jgi:hypothetical protein
MVIVRLILSENLSQLRRALIGDVELERHGMGNVRPFARFLRPKIGPAQSVRLRDAATRSTGLPKRLESDRFRSEMVAIGAILADMIGAWSRRRLVLAIIVTTLALACFPLASRADDLRRGVPVLLVDDPLELAALEGAGYGISSAFGATNGGTNQALLAQSPAYRDIAAVIHADVDEIQTDMAAHGRKLFKATDANVGRVIDLGWLASPIAHYALAGVVNRIDRRDFLALEGEAQSCGEVRFIYRLSYDFDDKVRHRRFISRLPFNFNVVYTIPRGEAADCGAAARSFIPDKDVPVSRVPAWLAAGPLARDKLKLGQIEFNAQVVRFPSGMETEFGGQALYLMRIFKVVDGRAIEQPLENTPDVARLSSNAAARKALVDYVTTNLPAIDRGVFAVPEELLARRALSYSTFGSERFANHPYAQILREADFSNDSFAGLNFIRTPRALIERLDNASCTGCHQTNATAGFHLIGRDPVEVPAINRVKIGVSPHLFAELPRRRAYVEALAADAAPDLFRPLSSAPKANWAGDKPIYDAAAVGMPCLMDGDAGNFSGGWRCAANTACHIIARDAKLPLGFGQCAAARDQDMFSGHPCLEGDIETNSHPYLDHFKIGRQFAAFSATITDHSYSCRPPELGVPGGAAYRKCTDADRAFEKFNGGPAPTELCGFAGGKSFDDCVATNDFAACLGKSIVRGNRQTCGGDRFCREDFMCQEMPGDVANVERIEGYGYCSPTYFLFQMRIDGHPDPRGQIQSNAR